MPGSATKTIKDLTAGEKVKLLEQCEKFCQVFDALNGELRDFGFEVDSPNYNPSPYRFLKRIWQVLTGQDTAYTRCCAWVLDMDLTLELREALRAVRTEAFEAEQEEMRALVTKIEGYSNGQDYKDEEFIARLKEDITLLKRKMDEHAESRKRVKITVQ